jgi:MoaA/NifB/PqqE/SkfB family radical SAM enzyme
MEHPTAPDFATALEAHGLAGLRRLSPTTLQVNVGKRCNQACHHCHVDAGPKRTEVMTDAVAERIVTLLERHPSIALVDVTGGAPSWRRASAASCRTHAQLGRRVIDRCNPTVLLEPAQEDLAASSPPTASRSWRACRATARRTSRRAARQGVFEKSIRALAR